MFGPARVSRGDELLAVISARKRLSWRFFRDAFDTLHADALRTGTAVDSSAASARVRTTRLLSELGHVEVLPHAGSATICAAPSILARLPQVGLPRACLCGARSLHTTAELRNVAARFGKRLRVLVRKQPFSGGYAPDAIELEATDVASLEEAATLAGVEFALAPPAWQLLGYSGSLAEYDAALDWNAEADPAWPRKDFDANTMTFRFGSVLTESRLSVFQDPVTRRQIHRLWRSRRAATVDRDWGRWLHLRDLGRSVIRFSEARQELSVPVTVPLPALLGRSMALCTGLAPTRRGTGNAPRVPVDVYQGVGAAAAALLATKLGNACLVEEDLEGGA